MASIDFTGILVYVVWVWRQLGFTAARPKILAMIAGGCLFGVPYLVFFLFPNWNAILSLAQSVQASGGPLRAVRLALAAYRAWAGDSSFLGWHGRPMLSALTFPVRWSLVPAAVLGPLLLLPHRSTRGIALAALPHLLFLWLYFRDTGKALNLGYYVPEFMLYVSGLIIALLAAALWAAQWLTPRPYRWLVLPAMTPLIAAWTLASVPIAYGSDAAEISLVPRLDDMDVARASGMAMLGPGAFVGASDLSAWYTPGATHVYGTWAELDYARDLADFDIPRYLSSFDALVVDARTDKSGMTSNFQRKTPTAWYMDRTLNLRGFYFGNIGVRSWSSAASYLLLSPQAAGPLVGYAFWRGALYRFQQQAGGDTVLVTAVCSGPAIERMIPFDDQKTHGFFTLSLPGARPSNRPDYRWALDDGVIKVMLIDRLKYEGIRPLLRGDCRLRDEIWGTLGEVPVRSMLAQLHREDRPIRFYETLTNAIANVKGTLVTMMSPQSRSYDAGRSSRLFAADFTRGWELTSAKPGIQIADDLHTAKITTDGSAYRWQLLSPPITTPPRSTYLLKFDLTIERGGAGVQIVTADRRITLAALCESAPTGRHGEHQVFFKTGDQYAVEIAITNCGSPRPATSVFWIRNMQIWGQR